MVTSERGYEQKSHGDLTLYSSKGIGYIKPTNVVQGRDYIEKYKVMISRVTSEHAGEPDKSGMYKVISNMKMLLPNEICTDSYIIAFPNDSKEEVVNFY